MGATRQSRSRSPEVLGGYASRRTRVGVGEGVERRCCSSRRQTRDGSVGSGRHKNGRGRVDVCEQVMDRLEVEEIASSGEGEGSGSGDGAGGLGGHGSSFAPSLCGAARHSPPVHDAIQHPARPSLLAEQCMHAPATAPVWSLCGVDTVLPFVVAQQVRQPARTSTVVGNAPADTQYARHMAAHKTTAGSHGWLHRVQLVPASPLLPCH